MNNDNIRLNMIRLSDITLLEKYYKRWLIAYKYTDFTWIWLFKTKSYYRLKKHKIKLHSFMDNYIKREITQNHWHITYVHSIGYVILY